MIEVEITKWKMDNKTMDKTANIKETIKNISNDSERNRLVNCPTLKSIQNAYLQTLLKRAETQLQEELSK